MANERAFAVATSDRQLGIFEAFLAAGWQPCKLFISPVDERLAQNKAVIALARRLKLDIQLSPLRPRDMEDLGARGCRALVVATYPWRIPPWQDHLQFALNFHPSPLPHARGPYPQVRAILEERHEWAITCHQLAADFDTGAILASQHFPLEPMESHETIELKLQIAGRHLAERVAGELPRLWSEAKPQAVGSYWPLWTEDERRLDFGRPVGAILRQVRAFGRIESTAIVNKVSIFVRRAEGWHESHRRSPGSLVHTAGTTLVVAAKDGLVALTDWSLTAPDQVTGTPLR